MAQLLRAVEEDSEPEIAGSDNLKTLALVEACYRSIEEERKVKVSEFI
jgi:predicted dehydrogenase